MSDSTSPAYEAKNAWTVYESPEARAEAEAFCRGYLDFLSSCKTERETVAFCERALKEAGYSEDPASGAHVAVLRGKALFAFRKGSKPLSEGIRMVAAHGDCPRLDFKPRPLFERQGLVQAKTHYYGGLRKYQWLARPLALRGVVIREDGSSVPVSVGEDPGDPVFTIADLLPHLAQKQVTQTVKEAFEGEKLNVLLASVPKAKDGEKEAKDQVKAALLDLLKERHGFTEEDLLSAEIEAVPAGPARFVGFDRSLAGGFGQDDRICVYTGLRALLDASEGDGASRALVIWDKEEIGSDGATGASSRFLEYCVDEARRAHAPETPLGRVLLASSALSADVTAGMDPNWEEVQDSLNACVLGYGPCVQKYTGSGGKYGTSDAEPEFFAWLRGVLNRRNVPWQAGEMGRVDHGGGGTVAMFLAALGMNVIDCGPALLGMHSPFEISSVADVYATWHAYKAFYEG